MLRKQNIHEFREIYKILDRAISKRSLTELDKADALVKRMGVSSSFKLTEGIRNIRKGLEILYEE